MIPNNYGFRTGFRQVLPIFLREINSISRVKLSNMTKNKNSFKVKILQLHWKFKIIFLLSERTLNIVALLLQFWQILKSFKTVSTNI
jgi:hypothetical protein